MVGTDFSVPAGRAFGRALRLPLTDDATITLLHVVPIGVPGRFENTMWSDARDALAQQVFLAGETIKNVQRKKVRIVSEIVRGKPFAEILERAKQDNSELIVLGRHGRRGIREIFLGSTAERVVRLGSFPTLLTLASPASPYRTPIATLDGSEDSDAALSMMLRVLDGPMNMIDAISAYEVPFENILTKAGVSLMEIAQHKAEARKIGWNLIQNAVSEQRKAVRWNTILRVGDPRRVIIEEVSSGKHDLVALGRRGRTKLPQLLLGGVAEAVLRAAPSDMLFGPLDRSDFELL